MDSSAGLVMYMAKSMEKTPLLELQYIYMGGYLGDVLYFQVIIEHFMTWLQLFVIHL